MSTVVKRVCACGGKVRASGSYDLVAGIAKAFDAIHQGDGHGPVSPSSLPQEGGTDD